MKCGILRFVLAAFISFSFLTVGSQQAGAASASELNRNVHRALNALFQASPAAVKLSKEAAGILVFPKIYKAGFIIGGQYGEGALVVRGKIVAYYQSAGGSYGLQAGAQAYGYALFFMTKDALKYLNKSDGWEIGVGPSIVVVDQGMAKSFTTTTGKDNIYAFFFNQEGLMAGLGIQGNKITKFQPR